MKAILLVDDDPSILKVLKAQLKRHFSEGYIYEQAENAEEAEAIVDELDQNSINCVIIVSDWLMPGIKGDEFLIQIHQKFPRIKKIMLTGHATEEAIENAKRNADLYSCIHKPWKEEDLINNINDILSD